MTVDKLGTELAAPALANVFPARVFSPDGAVHSRDVRVIITADRAVIYDEHNRRGEPRRVYTKHVVDVTAIRPDPERAGAWIVTAADNTEWQIRPGGGCGCGSALKHMPSPPPVHI